MLYVKCDFLNGLLVCVIYSVCNLRLLSYSYYKQYIYLVKKYNDKHAIYVFVVVVKYNSLYRFNYLKYQYVRNVTGHIHWF